VPFYDVFLNAREHLTEKFNEPQIESPTLSGQRHVGPDAQALGDALPAILSVKSALSVVKNRIKFLPQIAQRTQMNHKVHKQGCSVKKKDRCVRVFARCGTGKLNLELDAVQLGTSPK
jgi:hypothetical protein